MKYTLWILVLVIICVGIYQMISSVPLDPESQVTEELSPKIAGMRAESNMIVILDQAPGKSAHAPIISLQNPGYLVILEDANGEPGNIIGTSMLLPAGDSADVRTELTRPMKEGELLHAALYFEKGDNTTFDGSADIPVPSQIGGFIQSIFTVSNDVPADAPIAI